MRTLTGTSRLAGILGWPVSHSRSPRLHGFWLARHGVDGAYVPLPVRPDRFEAAVRGLEALGFAGANVTIPHKEAAYSVCDGVSDIARRAGSVNTLIFRDGRIEGTSTDGFGFLESIRDAIPGWRAADGPAVVLGAGGAVRAVAAALLDAGCPRLTLVNRTPERAAALARDLSSLGGGPIHVAAAPPLGDCATLVNGTSLGMTGEPPLEIDLAPLPVHAVVCDMVYVPLETPLLASARARGLRAVDGLGMLLHQARPGFEAWFGIVPTVDAALREHVLRDLR